MTRTATRRFAQLWPSVLPARFSAAATATWFDGQGSPDINIDAMGRPTHTTFDAQHQRLTTTRHDGSTISCPYDTAGPS
ncbi:MAG: hypothetical protein ACYCV4_20175, partial [Dermatophilaceae bacterium]